ncbi:MAG TPA: DUF3857 domain-containing protein [Mucilaginibacter sp.]|nr:DUF3857 domain-containing protein [Mucilaginibacter sp.]
MCWNKYLRGVAGAAVLCVFIAAKVTGQDKDIPKELYTASGIPDSLKEDANSVVRYSYHEITIKGSGKATVKHHSILTILNEKAERQAIIQYGYNRKYDTYSFVDIHIYDDKGKMIKKYHKSDMYDGADDGDETLVSDERFLALKHTIANYPATIEIEYEESLTSFITPDDWDIQDHLEQSVQNSTYKVLADPSVGFKYKCKNISLSPKKTDDPHYEVFTWELKNLKPIKKEENVRGWTVLPRILFSTSIFNCRGYPGDLSTWQSFGKWMQGLNTDVGALTTQRVLEIRKMTDTIKTDKEKVRFLYKYMQQSMRYVSIQLGIGGWKPFAATFVDDKKYGDCKALSNYMRALLKAVDINSYYAVINAGANAEPADFSFPHNYFNHVILCVPFKNDTTWLECTSNTQPFGKLGSFTENRKALIVTEDGGKLISTPKSTSDENQFNSEVHIKLEADGSAKAKVKIFSTGDIRDVFVDLLPQYKADQQKESLLRFLNIKQPSSFDFQLGTDINGTKETSLDLDYDKFCDVMAGDKQFIRPRVLSWWDITVPITEKRKADYYFKFPLQESSVTTIELPTGFEVEAMPVNVNLKFSYGSYNINYAYNAAKNEVISTAKFVLNNQLIPAAKYTEMQQYMDGIAKAQNKKLVIRRKA